MEMFSADDDEQWAIIQEMINCTDYYVVIIGHKYGSLTSEGISYTEKEYDYAREKGIPIMAFVRNRDVSLRDNERESSVEMNEKLDAFIRKATENKMCSFWESIDDLTTKVAVALPKMFGRKPQLGLIRGNEGVSTALSNEFVELSNENRRLRE